MTEKLGAVDLQLSDALKITIKRGGGDPCGFWFPSCCRDDGKGVGLQAVFRQIAMLEHEGGMIEVIRAVQLSGVQ